MLLEEVAHLLSYSPAVKEGKALTLLENRGMDYIR